jgi:pyridoxamine 5'-phosphate oxidase
MDALHEADVDPDPIVEFRRWYDDARVVLGSDADAVTVATASADAIPSARMVLLRGFDARGFCFFTNFTSHKGNDLSVNPHAAMVCHWRELRRQVRIVGPVEVVADDEADDYWSSRPVGSRWSALASEQSRPVGSRAVLEARVEAIRDRDGDEPARPSFWGGYRIVPEAIEFWLHRDDRLHDRLQYSRPSPGAPWTVERLQP